MKKSIYNIEAEYLQLADAITEQGGEVTEEQETALTINKEELQVKAANYGYVIKDIDDNIVSIQNEIERLTSLKKAAENTKERLKDAVHTAMDMYGIEEIKLNNIKINFRKSTSVAINDENQIPAKYRTVKTVESISKKDITTDIKAGVSVPGASLQENKSLQIK